MIAVGKKVYSFTDSPFTILKGKVVGHREANVKGFTFYLCKWYDPVLKRKFTELTTVEPFKTKKKAKRAHKKMVKRMRKQLSKIR